MTGMFELKKKGKKQKWFLVAKTPPYTVSLFNIFRDIYILIDI